MIWTTFQFQILKHFQFISTKGYRNIPIMISTELEYSGLSCQDFQVRNYVGQQNMLLQVCCRLYLIPSPSQAAWSHNCLNFGRASLSYSLHWKSHCSKKQELWQAKCVYSFTNSISYVSWTKIKSSHNKYSPLTNIHQQVNFCHLFSKGNEWNYLSASCFIWRSTLFASTEVSQSLAS